MSLTGIANAYVPTELLWDVVGRGGTRYDCLGGDEASLRSTLTYVSYASPNEASGTQASRREEASRFLDDEPDDMRTSSVVVADFC